MIKLSYIIIVNVFKKTVIKMKKKLKAKKINVSGNLMVKQVVYV